MKKNRFYLLWMFATTVLLVAWSALVYDTNNAGDTGLAVFWLWVFGIPFSAAMMGIVQLIKFIVSKKWNSRN